jgi:hypothetical protein
MKKNTTKENKFTKISYNEGGEKEVSMHFNRKNMLFFISIIFLVKKHKK